MSSLFLALSFLTILPVRQVKYQAGALAKSAYWFPLIGLLLGGLLYAIHYSLNLFFPSLLAATLTVVAWVALTGALHLDGVADCCDGLLVAVPKQRRLEIMKDPHVGAFGAIGAALCLILKVTSVASINQPIALLFAPTFARWTLLLVSSQSMARPGGLGDEFGKSITSQITAIAAIVPMILLLLFASWQATAAFALAILTTLWLIHFAHRRLGGATGDVFGLVVEMSELAVLLVFAIQR